MSLYAVVLNETGSGFSVGCGSSNYVKLDGRLSPFNALNEAIEHFTATQPKAKHIAVFRAPSLGAKGQVIATFPHGRNKIYQSAVNEGCYK